MTGGWTSHKRSFARQIKGRMFFELQHNAWVAFTYLLSSGLSELLVANALGGS